MQHVRHDERIPQTFMLVEQVVVVGALLLVDKRCWLVWGIPNLSKADALRSFISRVLQGINTMLKTSVSDYHVDSQGHTRWKRASSRRCVSRGASRIFSSRVVAQNIENSQVSLFCLRSGWKVVSLRL